MSNSQANMRMAIRVRSSSILNLAMLFFVMLLQLQYEAIHSASPTTYLDGDDVDLEGWTKGKNFHAGDILKFKNDFTSFDVSIVDKGHDTCRVNDKSIQFDTGNDKIPLAFGPNYFICGRSDICAAGLKRAINATAPPPPST